MRCYWSVHCEVELLQKGYKLQVNELTVKGTKSSEALHSDLGVIQS